MASVYLPDTSHTAAEITSARDLLNGDIAHYSQRRGHVLLLGDFNARVAAEPAPLGSEPGRAPTLGAADSNTPGVRLMQLCEEHDMFFRNGRTALACRPTCREQSIIDHIIGSRGTLPWSHSVASLAATEQDVMLCASDHAPLVMTVPIREPGPKPSAPEFLRWRLGSLADSETSTAYVQALLSKKPKFTAVVGPMMASAATPTQADVETAMLTLSDIIHDAARGTVGQARIAPGKTKPWMSTALRRTLTCRRDAHTRWYADKSEANAKVLVDADASARSALRKAKRATDKRCADSLNEAWAAKPGGHAAWHALKSSRSADKSIRAADALASPSGELHTDPASKVSILREHYAKIATPSPPLPALDGSEEAEVQAHHAHVTDAVAGWRARPLPDDPVIDERMSQLEVAEHIARLKRYKSPGPDGIPNELLREGGAPVTEMLTTLFKLVWRAELVPCAWRHGVITSLFKAGDRAECNNYRPITLLPTIGKLFTAIMATRLERFVRLHDHQSAFRKARGTMDPLFVFSATILERKARGLRTHAFFLDLKKAYDMVWHDGLFYKLHKKGVKAKTWRLIWDMYSKGENSASLDGHVSAPFRLLQGVAQGDPMSCVLFNVMIDDLIDTLERTHGADGVTLVPGAKNLVAQGYADDISSPSGTRVGLQRIINTYSSHLARWKGVVNIDKSCTLTFNLGGAAVDSTGAHIADDGEGAWNWNGTPMPHVHKIKYLGLVFTSDCTWDAHVARARECGFGALAMWRGVLRNNLLTLGTKLTVISACIKTPITYGMEVWAPRTTACAKALEVPLRRALRAALGVPSGEARALYPVDLVHYDTAVRTIASETRAAHVRYWQRVRSFPEARLQRVTLDKLPGTHPWLRRALQWRDELVEADPEAPIADILTDEPPPLPLLRQHSLGRIYLRLSQDK